MVTTVNSLEDENRNSAFQHVAEHNIILRIWKNSNGKTLPHTTETALLFFTKAKETPNIGNKSASRQNRATGEQQVASYRALVQILGPYTT